MFSSMSSRLQNVALSVVLAFLLFVSMMPGREFEGPSDCKILRDHSIPDNVNSSQIQFSRRKKTFEEYRREIAKLSLDMMEEDTNERALETPYMDISPFVKVIKEALDDVGIRGVYDNLFRQEIFSSTMTQVAQERGLVNFSARVAEPDGAQPHIEYTGIPNNGPNYPNDDLNWGLGGWWWDVHYVGAITAEKLVREGSLLLNHPHKQEEVNVVNATVHNDDTNPSSQQRFIYDAAAFFKEYRSLMRSRDPDLMPMHAIHGFIWQYVALTRSGLLEYPTELLYALFCTDGISQNERIESLHNSMTRECRHGFGHAIYYLLALHDLGTNVDVRRQLRMAIDFDLSEESRCLGYKLCESAPSDMARRDCRMGLDHSRGMFSTGRNNARDKDLLEHFEKERKRCLSS